VSLLLEYINNDMRMMAVYQPVIIKKLLGSTNPVLLQEIGIAIAQELGKPKSSVEYYVKKIRIHPKKVLTKKNIASIDLASGVFIPLRLIFELSGSERLECVEACNKKIRDYKARVK